MACRIASLHRRREAAMGRGNDLLGRGNELLGRAFLSSQSFFFFLIFTLPWIRGTKPQESKEVVRLATLRSVVVRLYFAGSEVRHPCSPGSAGRRTSSAEGNGIHTHWCLLPR
ncbi:hypothetical protein XA68_17439 [Ophiocordyceps unilateralis]|uniref:Uncharacterized protein n=1 Tax=Ophiocordyceps unilateralis TaxID=268505 RepID=A0A2A9P4V7_OPHUN|nr:hypothetical protein XA68_17439 [Ophiocordyceps unilateralis]